MSTTAEWRCTRCGATNRKIVREDARSAVDVCVSCHTRHVVERGDRPAFWTAKAA